MLPFFKRLIFLLLSFIIITNAQDKLYHNAFSLSDVTLCDGPFKHARDLNIEVLLKYDVDRLLAPYRKEAGLSPRDSSYSNWVGLDGHIGGHYLSAMAMNYAATGNAECKKRMEYMVAELQICQQASIENNKGWGKGYVGGVPNSELVWQDLKRADFTGYSKSWVPWYNLHKIYAGLRDAWLYGDNEHAKTLFLKFCDWAIYITKDLTDTQMESMLDTEHGGMNEIFADAFQMSGEQKYLVAARRFSYRQLLDAMAERRDNLDNKHANTQVPKAIGFQRIGELSGDEKYVRAASFFWETVTNNRSLVFGGNSRKEHFPSKAASLDYINDVEGPESCNTHNMLKLTVGLFRNQSLSKYTDFYERALYNHILSSQHPQHGGYVYFTPARPQHYRVYSQPNQAMWCCVGSGMENHGKYNNFIYTHDKDLLYVNLFIASELAWQEKGIRLRQDTRFPYEEKTRLTIQKGSARFALMIRYPSWVASGNLKVTVNDKDFNVTNDSSSYVTIDRLWRKGDIVSIDMPMQTTMESLPNVSQYVSFMHGPIVLAAKTGSEDLAGLLADDSRWGHIAHGQRLAINEAPVIVEQDVAKLTDKIHKIDDKPLTFSVSQLQMINPRHLILEPFFSIHDSRYIMYWMALSNNQYQSYLDSVAAAEKEMLALQQRTIDYVATGEQQPEADHGLQSSNSNSGNSMDAFWRDARDGGFFSYQLATNNETSLRLMVRYWGYEWGGRKFDIFIDDEKLITEDNSVRWYQSSFQEVFYEIPDTMVRGKDYIRVKFQAKAGSVAGAVYNIRLLRQQ